MKDLVITGVGVITSIGSGSIAMMQRLIDGESCFSSHRQIQDEGHKPLVAYVEDKHLVEEIGIRALRKLDRFTLLSMQAFRQALNSAKLDSETAHEFGLLIGNSTGGWSFVEPQMDDIYKENYDALSPYVATAWFPSAPQGEISILHKISGYSKTFAADALSVGYALEHACYLLTQDYLPGVFLGGVEAPLSPLVYNSCLRIEPLSVSDRYLPFHTQSDGYLLGEGAGFLTIESYDHVVERKKIPLARISGIGTSSTLSESIKICLDNAKKRPEDIDCILLDAKGTNDYDDDEYAALEKIFCFCENLHLTTTKTLHGSLLAADLAVQLVIAVLSLTHQTIPRGLWSKDGHKHSSFGNLVLDKPVRKKITNILTYARNLDGSSYVVLISLV
ncbi:MAG: beta-ketoacyl synthase N-terminal-like domain-containing protein [Chlamydiales bacterium]|nr:beta-ketoacyl synthase N-terminal-like domain-containing protein [Chlamydiales bacterium]